MTEHLAALATSGSSLGPRNHCVRPFAVVAVLMTLACAGCQGAFDVARPGTSAARAGDAVIPAQGPPDQELERRLGAIYSEVNGLEDVHARVQGGVAHLSGTAENVTRAHQAVALARRLEGVVYVSNDIRSSSSQRWFSSISRTLRSVGAAVVDVLPRVTAAILVFVPFLWLSWVLGKWQHPLRVFGLRKLTGSLVRFVLRGILLLSGFLLAFNILGIMGAVGALVGALGILGLASGILFKDWLANYFPAFLLGMHPPFKAGDLIQIGSHEGRVIQITPRATVLMTTDGEVIRLPNSLLMEEPMINFSQQRERRLRFVMPLSPRADLGMAHDVGCRALLELHGIKNEPPPFMRTQAVHRDAVDVEFFAWVDQDAVNFRSVSSRARRAVFEALSKAGVPLPTDARELTFRYPESARSAAESEAAEGGDDAFLASQLERTRERLKVGERDLLEEGTATSSEARRAH